MHSPLTRSMPWYADYMPTSRSSDPTTLLLMAFAAGAAFGAAVMYMLDPDRGRGRRALMRDQVVHTGHEVQDLGDDARGRAQDLRNRARGTVAEARSGFSGGTSPD